MLNFSFYILFPNIVLVTTNDDLLLVATHPFVTMCQFRSGKDKGLVKVDAMINL